MSFLDAQNQHFRAWTAFYKYSYLVGSAHETSSMNPTPLHNTIMLHLAPLVTQIYERDKDILNTVHHQFGSPLRLASEMGPNSVFDTILGLASSVRIAGEPDGSALKAATLSESLSCRKIGQSQCTDSVQRFGWYDRSDRRRNYRSY